MKKKAELGRTLLKTGLSEKSPIDNFYKISCNLHLLKSAVKSDFTAITVFIRISKHRFHLFDLVVKEKLMYCYLFLLRKYSYLR